MFTRTENIAAGDLIRVLANWHRVTSVARTNRFGWPIADCEPGYYFTLEPGQKVETG